MSTRERGFGVFALSALAIVASSLAACGQSKGGDGGNDDGSGAKGGSSGASAAEVSGGSSQQSTGGSNGESTGAGGATGGSATGGRRDSGAGTAGAGGTGESSGGSTSAGESSGGNTSAGGSSGGAVSASLQWIEAIPEHRARAASETRPAFLRTLLYSSFDGPVLFGTSDLIIGKSEEVYIEGLVWTQATGTIALGRLPGVIPAAFTAYSVPSAVSADGSVVVGTTLDSQRRTRPFRWTRAGGLEAIGEVGSAVAVSADGSVVVGDHIDGVFRWTRELGAVTIVQPPDGAQGIRALEVSADGMTVVGQAIGEDGIEQHLVVWTEASGARAIENPPGYPWCAVQHHRSSGSNGFVVGGWCFTEVGHQSYLWAGQDQLVTLGSGNAVGVDDLDYPAAITDDGSVGAGNAILVTGESRAYRWTEASGIALIELPDGYTNSSVTNSTVPRIRSMSVDGSVVVGNMTGIAEHAFRWSDGTGSIVLSPLDGQDISRVAVLSADGSIAAGTSRLGSNDPTVVYWRADGVAHRIAGELAARGVDLGTSALLDVRGAHATLSFVGSGSKDEVSKELVWHAELR